MPIGSAHGQATPTTGGNLGPGSYQCAVTYLTASGESTAGAGLGVGDDGPDAARAADVRPVRGGLPDDQSAGPGRWRHAPLRRHAFLTASNGGQTLAGPASAPHDLDEALTGCRAIPGIPSASRHIPTGGSTVTGRRVYRTKAVRIDVLRCRRCLRITVTTSFTDTLADRRVGAARRARAARAPATLTTAVAADRTCRAAAPASRSGGSIAGRRIPAPASLRLLVELANNTTTTYTDTTATGSLGGGAADDQHGGRVAGRCSTTCRSAARTSRRGASIGRRRTAAARTAWWRPSPTMRRRSLVDSVPDAASRRAAAGHRDGAGESRAAVRDSRRRRAP